MSLARSQDAKTTQNILKEKEEQTKQRRRGTKPKSPQRSTNLKQGMPSLFWTKCLLIHCGISVQSVRLLRDNPTSAKMST